MSMIVNIYFFVSGGQLSDALGGLGLCGYTLVRVCDNYHIFICVRWAVVRCRRWIKFLWLHTLVYVFDS